MATDDVARAALQGLAAKAPEPSPRLRRVVPGLGLFAAYWLLSLLNDPAGFLGTDTGGKVATLKAMADNGTFTNVDVGYWAVQWDPEGLLHPLYNSIHIGDHWVQVTTLPMLLLGEPLYRVGGYQATLVLPILGAVACAYAARSLATRFGADARHQWAAFWIIGLASPVVIYALDFWEHTIGLALMVWGTIALLDLLEAEVPKRRVWLAAAAGLAFGSAYTMRTEALVYLVVIGGAVAVTLLVRRARISTWLSPGVSFVVGVAIPTIGSWLLSRWILGDGLREGRTGGAASGFGSNIPERLREGLVTTFGLGSDSGNGALAVGVLATVLVGFAVARGRRGGRKVDPVILVAPLVCAGLLWLITFANGLGFVSGLFGAAPLAVAGVAMMRRPEARPAKQVAVIAALVALPVVWAFQWTGGAGPQWGGRYVMCSMFILVVAGVASLQWLRKPVPQILIGFSIVITVFGLAWVSVRTHDVARVFDTLNARAEPVLIADVGMQFVPREGGASYGEHHWLTAPTIADRTDAADVVEQAGFTSFGLVAVAPTRPPATIGAFEKSGTSELRWFQGVTLVITTYELPSTATA